jgi:hypothetical protein
MNILIPLGSLCKYCHIFMDVTLDRVWIGELDLLTTCTHHLKLHFTNDWHTQTSVLKSDALSTVHFLATDFNTGTITVSLNYTFQISLYYNIRKVLTASWAPVQSQGHIATDGQSVSLGVEPNLVLMTRYLLLFDSLGIVIVGHPLWQEDGSAFCQSDCPQ